MLAMTSDKRHLTYGMEDYQIKTSLERAERRKPTNTSASWRQIPSAK